MSHSLTIRARLNEKVNAEGIGEPVSVTVTGAEFMSMLGIGEIVQELVNGYYGTAASEHGYFAQTYGIERGVLMTVPVEFIR